MDDRVYYLAWAGIVAAVPLSAIGFADLLPASVSARTTGGLSLFWFGFCGWSVAWTFWVYGPRYEARQARQRAAWESSRTDEEGED